MASGTTPNKQEIKSRFITLTDRKGTLHKRVFSMLKRARLTNLAFASFALFLGQLYMAQQEHQVPVRETVDVDGASLDVDIWRSGGDTIIALPGLGSDTTRFELLAPKIASAGYRVVLLNSLQIRRSTGSPEDLTLVVLATDVLNVAYALNAKKVHLKYDLSWSGSAIVDSRPQIFRC